jgi:hypothetical protein
MPAIKELHIMLTAVDDRDPGPYKLECRIRVDDLGWVDTMIHVTTNDFESRLRTYLNLLADSIERYVKGRATLGKVDFLSEPLNRGDGTYKP